MKVVMCPKHNRPALPVRAKNHRTACSSCQVESYAKGRKSREMRWMVEFIPCIRHPERRCKRSEYVKNCVRRCASCTWRNANGQSRSILKRNRLRRTVIRSLKRRARGCHSSSLQGLKLFERMTG